MKNNNDDKFKEVLKPKVINNEDDKEKEKKEVYEKLLNGNVPEDDVNKKSTGLTKAMVGIAAGAVVVGTVTMAALATTDDELDSHTVSFDYNIEMEEVYSSEEVKVGARVGDLVPRKVRGYKFIGWFKDESFTQPYSDDDIIPTKAVVYGKYLPIYKVEFPKETVGYSFVIEDKEIVSGDDYSFEIKLLDSHSKSSVKAYLIRGEGERLELTPNAKGKYTIKNIESHCKIEVEGVVLNTYTVTFKNGVNVLKKETITHNEFAIGDDIEEPVKDHHKFIGWGVTTDKEEFINLSEYNIKEDTILHAKFEQLQYTVQFVSGNDDLSRYDFTYGGGDYLPTSLSLPTPTPDKASTEEYFYVFAGWSITENGEVITDFSSVQIVGDTKLYAVYTEYSFMNVSLSIEGNLTTYEMQVGANLKENINALVANDTIDITDENSIGWYYDDKFSKPVLPDDLVPYKVTLYSRYATLDKISIVDGVASAIDSTISGEVVIPACVRELGGFIYCGSIDGVFIPYGVEVIGNYCFEGTALNSVNIPSSVTTIGDYAFSGGINISEITIPESVTSIGGCAFFGALFERVEFNANISVMSWRMFDSCSNLKEISIPANVKTIEWGVFYGCENLSLTIPATVTEIEDFSQFATLKEFAIHPDNQFFMIEDNIIFSKDKKVLYCYLPSDTRSEYNIPEGVEIIYDSAFKNNDTLEKVTIPSSVVEIGDWAFYKYDEKAMYILSSVIFAENSNLEYIGYGAFAYNWELQSIVIPASVKEIDDSAFEGCELNVLTIENGSVLERIGHWAFSEASGLTEITIPASVKDIGEYAFAGHELTSVTFENPNNWCVNGTILEGLLDPSISATYLCGEYCEYPWTRMTEERVVLTISINAEEDEYIVDKGTNVLEYIQYLYDEGMIWFEDFQNAEWFIDETYETPLTENMIMEDNMTIYTLLATMDKIIIDENGYVRASSSNISGVVVLPNGVKGIADDGFYRLSNITKVIIPNSVEEIGARAFYGDGWENSSSGGVYTQLDEVIFLPGSKLTIIGSEAFYDCDDLKSITIPNSVVSIGKNAFGRCYSLNSTIVTIEGNGVWWVGGHAITEEELSNLELISQYFKHDYSAYSWERLIIEENETIVSLKINDNNYYRIVEKGTNLLEYINSIDAELTETYGENCGWFLNEKCINMVTSDIVIEDVTCIYTKLVTWDKIVMDENGYVSANGYNISGEVVLPKTAKGIADKGFWCAYDITSIVLNRVEEIGDFAFFLCGNLKEIVIPNSVKKIGDEAFYVSGDDFSPQAREIIFEEGSSLTHIGEYAFAGYEYVIEVIIPDSVVSIGRRAFEAVAYNNSGLSRITLSGEGVWCVAGRQITEEELSNPELLAQYFKHDYSAYSWERLIIEENETIVSLKINDNNYYRIVEKGTNLLEYINSIDAELTETYGENCGWFLNEKCINMVTSDMVIEDVTTVYTKLVTWDKIVMDENGYVSANGYNISGEVVLPKTAKGIAVDGFSGRSISGIIMPEGLEVIGNSAFFGCYMLTSVVIPSTVISIGNWAFEAADGPGRLSSFEFRKGSRLVSIGDNAIGMGNIDSIYIPASVTTLGRNPFGGFYGGVGGNIYVDENNEYFCSIDGVLYDKAITRLISCPKQKTEIVIPNSIRVIEEMAFYSNENLNSVIFQDGAILETISDYAFSHCDSLSSIVLPAGIISIGNSAFYACDNLKEVTIPQSTQLIGEWAFYYCEQLISVIMSGNEKWSNGTKVVALGQLDRYTIADYLKNNVGQWELLNLTENQVLISFNMIDEVSHTLNFVEYIATKGDNVSEYLSQIDIGMSDREYCGWFLDEDLLNIIPNDMVFTDNLMLYTRTSPTSRYFTIDKNGCLTSLRNSNLSGEVVLPLAVKSVNPSVFYLKSIDKIILPANMVNVDWLNYMIYLQTLNIHSGITNIGNMALCLSLESVVVSENNSVYSSIDGVLYSKDQTKLIALPGKKTECYINENVAIIEENAIGVSMYLTQINVSEDNANFSSLNGVLYNKDKSVLIACPAKAYEGVEFVIPEGVVKISSDAFRSNSMTSVVLPSTLKVIEQSAFSTNKENLVSIVFNGCDGWVVSSTSNSNDYYSMPSAVLADPAVAVECLVNIYSDEYPNNRANWYWERKEIINVNVVIDGVTNEVEAFEGITIGNALRLGMIPGVSLDNCAGLYRDAEYVNLISDDALFEEGMTIYARMATLDKINISSTGAVTCANTSIEGEVVLPMTATQLPYTAFARCTKITGVVIPSSVTKMSSEVFFSCTSLQKVEFTGESTLTELPIYSFYNCTSLTEIVLPSLITTIGAHAFYHTSITSIDISANVVSIGDGAFTYCTSLESINIEEGNVNYCSENGILFNKDKTKLMCYPSGKKDVSVYTIPSSVLEISVNAFAYNMNLTTVSIPNGVKTIGSNAFQWTGIAGEMYIPASVEVLTGDVFQGIGGLSAINVDENNANYSSVDGVLYNKDKTILMKCGRGLMSDGLVIPEGVEIIEDWAFYGCNNIQSWTLPSTLKTIGSNAFNLCLTMKTIVIPSSVTYISTEAFASCNNLVSVTFEDPSNWFLGDTKDATSGTDLDSVLLSDVSTAATYLKSTYIGKHWIKKESE